MSVKQWLILCMEEVQVGWKVFIIIAVSGMESSCVGSSSKVVNISVNFALIFPPILICQQAFVYWVFLQVFH